ncbi:MAG: AbrB/MazE/SpoVT family DNA-binding domain-containing protein [Chloroflexota bacterium]|nr:MAG: AbrB/MazE/SpoVT family DNA-binding domain-containing protein [Chloroflexota bacterium]
MTARVKVSSKFQISVPADARRRLHLQAGDSLLVDVRDGYIVLIPEPSDYSQRLRGLHSDIWQGIEPQEYVRGEREAWQE